jgi:hypothetical protein
VLCDGDAGLRRLQREALPKATVVLDWWHAAVRFGHALQVVRGLGAGTADTHLASRAIRGLERAKWRLWHGRWPGCRRKLAALHRWAQCKHVRDVAGIARSSGTSVSCWDISSVTKMPWCITLPGVGAAKQSRPRS